MTRRCRLLLLALLACLPLSGQTVIGNVLRFPDRIMSGSRIGQLSQHRSTALPEWDFTEAVFSPDGTRPISADLDFLQHLRDNHLETDIHTLLLGSYAPSDTLTWLRGQSLFDQRKIAQAADLFASIPADSPFSAPARYHAVVAKAYLGDYDPSRIPAAADLYRELSFYQGGALALLRGDEPSWNAAQRGFGHEDYVLGEGERIMEEIARTRFGGRQKKAWFAGLASAVVPGLGKVYAGRIGEGVSAFLTVGTLGVITAEQWKKHGIGDWRTLLAGSLCTFFYIGNIYGSYLSVSIENDERLSSENTLILYHLHIPLRSLFR